MSVPNIPFVVSHVMPFKKGTIFFLKRFLTMMFLLVRNVVTDGLHIRFADSKCPITCLPREFGEFDSLGLDPLGGGFLHLFHRLAHTYRSREFKEDMNMIVHGIDECRRTFQLLEHNCHVGVERFPDPDMQKLPAILGAENEVDVKACERLRHDLDRPFRALASGYIFSQGVALGLGWAAPLGLRPDAMSFSSAKPNETAPMCQAGPEANYCLLQEFCLFKAGRFP